MTRALNHMYSTRNYIAMFIAAEASIRWRSISLALFLCLFIAPAHAERIKDLASIAGVRDNPLLGYGLVVGLDGTGGDKSEGGCGQ